VESVKKRQTAGQGVEFRKGAAAEAAAIDQNLLELLFIIGQPHKKVKRETEKPFKDLFVIRKKLGDGEVVITNGKRFPNAGEVSLFLKLLSLFQQNGYEELVFPSVKALLEFLYGEGNATGEYLHRWREAEQVLINQHYFFKDSFVFESGRVGDAAFGLLSYTKYEPKGVKKDGKLKRLEVRIALNPALVEVLKNSRWYRKVPVLEVERLRSPIAKALYLKLLKYRGEGNSWVVYLPKDLKEWYASISLSSVRPARALERLEKAVKEITQKTSLKAVLSKTPSGNYQVKVELKEESPMAEEEKVRKKGGSLSEEELIELWKRSTSWTDDDDDDYSYDEEEYEEEEKAAEVLARAELPTSEPKSAVETEIESAEAEVKAEEEADFEGSFPEEEPFPMETQEEEVVEAEGTAVEAKEVKESSVLKRQKEAVKRLKEKVRKAFEELGLPVQGRMFADSIVRVGTDREKRIPAVLINFRPYRGTPSFKRFKEIVAGAFGVEEVEVYESEEGMGRVSL